MDPDNGDYSRLYITLIECISSNLENRVEFSGGQKIHISEAHSM